MKSRVEEVMLAIGCLIFFAFLALSIWSMFKEKEKREIYLNSGAPVVQYSDAAP